MQIKFDRSELEPLVQQIVSEVLAQARSSERKFQRKMAYTEPEAAELLGLEPHQLRDERRRGCIEASQIVGRRIRYTPDDLRNYLASRRYDPDA